MSYKEATDLPSTAFPKVYDRVKCPAKWLGRGRFSGFNRLRQITVDNTKITTFPMNGKVSSRRNSPNLGVKR
jgi:hypothetical protein